MLLFEGCGTIATVLKSGRGAIESLNTQNGQIPYLSMTGNPYFGLRFYGTSGLVQSKINLNFSGGLGIRFDRGQAANSSVKMDVVTCNGAGSHCIETWNINALSINSVIAKNCGESGLLLQATPNAKVGLVNGNNVGAGTGYGTLRFSNRSGRRNDAYNTKIYIDKVVSRGGSWDLLCL